MTVPGRGGRPRKWKTPEALQAAIDAYFEACDNYIDPATGEPAPKPYTITGLAITLDMTRLDLLRYEGETDRTVGEDANQIQAYGNVIKKARARVEEQREEAIAAGKGHPAGGIFILKNMGWTDQIQVSLDSPVIVVRPPQVEGDPD